MGKPSAGYTAESDSCQMLTRGSETSQYPKEKKTIVISQVAASETEKAQTMLTSVRLNLFEHTEVHMGL